MRLVPEHVRSGDEDTGIGRLELEPTRHVRSMPNPELIGNSDQPSADFASARLSAARTRRVLVARYAVVRLTPALPSLRATSPSAPGWSSTSRTITSCSATILI